jgi:peptidoglycan/LPS O-acetylase OafA/YrhL
MVVPALIVPGYITGDANNVFTVVNTGLLRGVSGFSAGVIAYLIFDKLGAKLTLRPLIQYFLLLGLASFFISAPSAYGWPIIFYAVLICVLVALASNDMATVLSARPLVFLGTISFSIYLLHIPIYSALALIFDEQLIRGGGKVVVLVLILLVSAVSYKFIERPSQRLLVDFFGKWGRQRRESGAAA